MTYQAVADPRSTESLYDGVMELTAAAGQETKRPRRRFFAVLAVIWVFGAAVAMLDVLQGRRGLAAWGSLCIAAGVIPSIIRLYLRREDEHVPLLLVLLQMALLVAGGTISIIEIARR